MLDVEFPRAVRQRAVAPAKPRAPRLLACGGLTNAVVVGGAGEEDEELVTWGCADNDAIGRGGDENIPTRVELPRARVVITQISCGDCHGVAASLHGEVFLWGSYRDKDGKMWFPPRHPGDKIGPGASAKTPVLLDALDNVTQVACGSNHTAVVRGDGSVWTFGLGEQGQLGRPVATQLKPDDENYDVAAVLKHVTPAVVPGVSAKNVGCGGYHTLLVSTTRCEVWGFGLNQYRQVLGSVEDNVIAAPRKLDCFDGMRIARVDGGEHYSAALDEEGSLFLWGRSDQAQLGSALDAAETMPGAFRATPKRAALPDGVMVEEFACGSSHVVVATTEGEMFTWGFGAMNQLGHGNDVAEVRLPRQVTQGLAGKGKVRRVGAGGQHSAALVVVASGGESSSARKMARQAP